MTNANAVSPQLQRVHHHYPVSVTHPAAPVVLEQGNQEVLIALHVVRANKVLDGLRSLPSGVMRNLAGDVVGNVGLTDTVENVGADRAKELSVDSAESATSKAPAVCGVVGCRFCGRVRYKTRSNRVRKAHEARGRYAGGK